MISIKCFEQVADASLGVEMGTVFATYLSFDKAYLFRFEPGQAHSIDTKVIELAAAPVPTRVLLPNLDAGDDSAALKVTGKEPARAALSKVTGCAIVVEEGVALNLHGTASVGRTLPKTTAVS
jgi:hypothetical protein